VAYTLKYEQRDWGTERALILSVDGREVARRDPFWPAGIPASERKRKARLQTVGRAMIEAYEGRSNNDSTV